MKFTYNLNGPDCPNCAAKMERKIKALNGVESVSVNFLTQKLILECDETSIGDILPKAAEIMKKIDRDCSIAGK